MVQTAREIDDSQGIRELLTRCETLAVVGMKPRGQGPAWSVPQYMREQSYTTIPVNPKYQQIGGLLCWPTVVEVEQPVDVVVFFRRAENITSHVDEVLEMDPLPSAVWMQLGIRNDLAAQRLIAAGIDVVQDRCLAIEHPRLLGKQGGAPPPG